MSDTFRPRAKVRPFQSNQRFSSMAASVFAVSAIALSACASNATANGDPRIELPQQYRLGQETLLKTFERRSGKIAVVQSDGNLSVVDQTGGAKVQLTRDATTRPRQGRPSLFYQLPVWSPDGSQLAFVETSAERPVVSTVLEVNPEQVTIERGPNSNSVELGGDRAQIQSQLQQQRQIPQTTVEKNPRRVVIERSSGNSGLLSSAIYVASADGKKPLTELLMLNREAIHYLDWSPDGAQLAFSSERADQAQRTDTSTISLNIVSAAGGKMRQLINGASAVWHWNSDGKTLLAKVDAAGRAGVSALSLLDTQTDTASAVAARARLPFQTPQFSPDGSKMLITTEPVNGRSDLLVATRDGKAERRLASFSGRVSFTWSPDGQKVAYIVRESPTSNGGVLHMFDLYSGEDKILSQLPVAAFFWSPDSVRLLTFSPTRVQEMLPNFAGIDLTNDTPQTVFTLSVTDVMTRNTRQLFYIEPTEPFANVLSQFDRFNRAINLWSPDSKRIVFPISYYNGANLIVESEATGSIYPRSLGPGTMAVWSPK
ncbi:MAG: PD40 domain-containing protein [Anaerolineae bacterium]|nr:PD40 domain-containing protein [Anaerolineae bacterium]